MRIIDNFDVGLAQGADRPVLIDPDTGAVTTYGEVAAFTHRFAHAVRAHGYPPGAKIAVLSFNGVLMYRVVLGILRSDAVWLPINARISADECVETLRASGCDILFYEEQAESVARRIAAHEDLGIRIVPLIESELDAWIGDQPDSGFDVDEGDDALYAIQNTGGTTGKPKAVEFVNRNAGYIVRTLWTVCPFTPTERSPRPVFLAAAPLTHAGGQVMQLILQQGGAAVPVRPTTPAAMLALIERFGVTHCFCPPTVVYGMLDAPNLRSHDYSTLQYLIYGAAPMAPDKLVRAVDTFGPVLAQLYGQTETGLPNLWMSPAEHFVDGDPAKGVAPADRLASAGRITEGTDLVLLDDDGNIVDEVGATGEISIRGDGVTPGYYRNAEATAAVRAQGYHRTGDVAFVDADGFVHIVDRKKDMIITGGFNVYSAEVERRILAFPGVAECAVFGIPDEKWGEQITAALELVPGIEIDLDELAAFCHELLGGVKTPKQFFVVDRMPRSDAGKVLKRELREPFWAGRERMV